MIIFGYGKLGSSVATSLSELANKELFCLTKSDFPPLKSIEDAEDKIPNFSLNINPDSVVYFVCSGEEKIAGGILRTLEKIKEADSLNVDYDSLPDEISSRAKTNLLNTYLNSEVRMV